MVVVTLNVGLLRWYAGLLQPTPYVEERFDALAPALIATGADTIAVQEIYERRHMLRLRQQLAHVYPHAAWGGWRPWPLISSGLALFSRSPIAHRFVPFRDGPIDERMFARKGVLVAVAQGKPRIALLNVHTTAGGVLALPEDGRIERIRARQIAELLQLAADTDAALKIILGDLNAGPGVSDSNYRAFAQAGWVDAHSSVSTTTSEVTWDPSNPLNAGGPHESCPPQRIDHVFLRRADLERGVLTPVSSEVLFRTPSVRVGDTAVTLSDHYGLRVLLDVAGEPDRLSRDLR